jgi:Spx/MgsR family transcriptional regulator
MIIVYGIPNCNTVKKARNWLDERGVAYEFHDYKKKGISREKLDHWLHQLPWEKLLNRSGMTWRKLSDEQKNEITSADSAAVLMQSSTSIIKRPLIENANGQVISLGFSEKEYEQAFS